MTNLLALVIALSGVTAQAGTIWGELTPAQQARIASGSQVFIAKAVPGAPWPKAWIYQRVEATTEEAAAVFADYEGAMSYAPGLKAAKIARRVDPRTTEVNYTVGVPLVGDEHYTMRNTLSRYSAQGAAYRVDWSLLQSSSMKSSDGNIRFESHGTGTLVAYHSWVVPTSIFAGVVKNDAMAGLRDNVAALVVKIQAVRTREQALLRQQLAALRAALAR